MSAPRWVVLVFHEEGYEPQVYGAFKTHENAMREARRAQESIDRANGGPEAHPWRTEVSPLYPGRIKTGDYKYN